MGNKAGSPAFTYDAVCSTISVEELATLRLRFKGLCGNDRGGGAGLLDLTRFINKNREVTCDYLIENFLPRLFFLIAGGADSQTLKFEDYIGALALFRYGSKDDKLKCR